MEAVDVNKLVGSDHNIRNEAKQAKHWLALMALCMSINERYSVKTKPRLPPILPKKQRWPWFLPLRVVDAPVSGCYGTVYVNQ